MEYREQTSTYWDRLRNEADQYFLRGRLITDLKEYMQGRAYRILEIGCGEGLLLNEIRKANPNAECFGIELSENAVNAGKRKYPQIHFINQDLHVFLTLRSLNSSISCFPAMSCTSSTRRSAGRRELKRRRSICFHFSEN